MGTRWTARVGLCNCRSAPRHAGAARPGRRRRSLAGLVLGVAVTLCAPVATASATASCPNESLRTDSSAGLPDCRAFELVSPANKQRGEVFFPASAMDAVPLSSFTGPAQDGNHVMYWSFQPFAGTQNAVDGVYVASRSGNGWTSASISPTPTASHPWLFNSMTTVADVIGDFSKAIVSSIAVLAPLEQPANANPIIPNYYLRQPNGSFTWITHGNGEMPESGEEPHFPGGVPNFLYVGRSADMSHVLFQAVAKLVPADSGREEGLGLYQRFNGHTELVNVNSEGSLVSTCGANLGGHEETSRAVSEDGSRVYFTAPEPGGFGAASCEAPQMVYLRENGQTVQISKSQRTIPDPAGTQPAYFQGASADGSKAFFTSTEALTNEAQPGSSSSPLLYEYDALSGNLKLLTPNAGSASPDVLGVSAISPDGSHVYFVEEVHAGEVSTPTLEMYANGQVATIASVPLGPTIQTGAAGLVGYPEGGRPVRLSADGLHLVFGDRDNLTGFDSHGHQEIYLYDASTNTLRCVSCNSDGHVPLGEAYLSSDPASYESDHYPMSVNVTADGSRVFFETQDNLVPQDNNGVTDVYEWEAGADHLISGGQGSNPSYFVGSAQEGRDVFFATTNGLVAGDSDNGDNDIYDARVEGGFAAPAAPAGCTGEACQGQPGSPPALAAVGSATLQGQGNLAAPSHRVVSKHKHKRKRKHKRKHKRARAVNHGKSRSAGR